ncbi:MAG TPA: excinuclease ABC subunit C [Gammaproteobacteria bacterium]|nr:excinuclease ABC subunit C [Gammaproteobacteria bacterium]
MASDTPEFDSAEFLKTVSRRPGVYQMYNAADDVIYVGKAGNLRARLSSYFQKTSSQSVKTAALVAQICRVQTTVTGSEPEALILEQNLIKQHRPRYNVLLRDDKSYPYVYISTRDDFPRVAYQRGGRKAPGKYVGPFPNAGSVKKSLSYVQKLFRVRQCEDSYYSNRSRPCLQYQIKRCTAPCVGYVDEETYATDVRHTIELLEGKNQQVIADLVNSMEVAAENLDFERAALLRDQIADLKKISNTALSGSERGKVDIVACALKGGASCVQVFFLRNGINLGNKAFFPTTPAGSTAEDVLYAFLTQFYLQHEVPREIIVSHVIDEAALLQPILSERAGAKVVIQTRVRGERARLQALAMTNAQMSLDVRLSSRSGMAERYDSLRTALGIDDLPERMECFDISHTGGESTVASCVVFNAEGPVKSDYRRFNIENITPGDDYAAMRQALSRRYTRVLKENGRLPDILFIDGGKWQVGVAREVMQEIQLHEVQIVGVAKGPDRRPGEETLILVDTGESRQLDTSSPGLHLVQQIRDEAHRFAIAGHRARRAKTRNRSVLEDVPGLGPKRRKALMTHFGGLQGIQQASTEELARVPGISKTLAEVIFDALHPGS